MACRAFNTQYEAKYGPTPEPQPNEVREQRQAFAQELLAGALGVAEEDVKSLCSPSPPLVPNVAVPMNESIAHAGFGRLPLFYIPGIRLEMPVQGHLVQFWPFFLSRLQLVRLLKEFHLGMAEVWQARRRTEREIRCMRMQAEVMMAFKGNRRGERARPGASTR